MLLPTITSLVLLGAAAPDSRSEADAAIGVDEYRTVVREVKRKYDRCADLYNRKCFDAAVIYCLDAQNWSKLARSLVGRVEASTPRAEKKLDEITQAFEWYERTIPEVLDNARTEEQRSEARGEPPCLSPSSVSWAHASDRQGSFAGGGGGSVSAGGADVLGPFASAGDAAAVGRLGPVGDGGISDVVVAPRTPVTNPRIRYSRSSPYVLPAGQLQLDLGWTSSGDGSGSDRIRSDQVPQTVLRLGVHRRLELRFTWAGYTRLDDGDFDAGGTPDGAIEAKLALWRERGARPRLSLVVGTSLPFGEDPEIREARPGIEAGQRESSTAFFFSSERADPFIAVLARHSVTRRASLTYNLGVSRASGAETVFTTSLQTTGDVNTYSFMNYSVATDLAVSEHLQGGPKVGVALEFFGTAPLNVSGQTRNSVDGVFSYSFARSPVSLDLFAGRGVSTDATDWFAGIGATLRHRLW